eukprot:CAMPEP_0114614668 /NCGR_PEP_ID=MMETSP0168-20121206/5772_1 /TAXON_ID=95228 ORGANISM="Vannella sp., Strain DIVA3 517/6/12" /NCGR_SAMPLE_ID=MMETSP0168 /ASSEMBLY_ACC=CAM_ASM_000044 /LENGTH=1014 /DNA_ID=CAMNT_0001825723 /DNA_START=5 /DNA_END=3049 /DNA_ORIENTATION=+
MSVSVDAGLFVDHLKLLVRAWKEQQDDWGGASVLAIPYGKADPDAPYRKCGALHTWLFGYELSDSLIFITKEKFYFVGSKMKTSMLASAAEASSDFPVELVEYKRSDKEKTAASLAKLFAQVPSDGKVGMFVKETHSGPFAGLVTDALGDKPTTEITAPFSGLLAIKDSKELRSVSRAVYCTSAALKKHLLGKLETVIDEEQKISHRAIADFVETKVTQHPETISERLKDEALEMCYPPIIQSGGEYNLKPSASSNDSNLHFGTIVCSVGVRYRGYCSNVARTFFVDPSDDQKAAYSLLMEVHASCLEAMKIGEPLSSVYEAAIAAVKAKDESLVEKFVTSCGFGMGLEYKERNLNLNAKNKNTFQEGMVFNLSIGFRDLERKDAKDEKSKIYSILVADTVFITKAKGAAVQTTNTKDFTEVAYYLEEDKEEDVDLTADDSKLIEKMALHTARKDRVDLSKENDEERRKQHQRELEEKQLAEKKQLYSAKAKGAAKPVDPSRTKDIRAYKNPSDFPDVSSTDLIAVDAEREAVLLPIYGQLVPFHISTIKNATKDGERLRINFLYPSTAANIAKLNHQAVTDQTQCAFIREMTFHIPKASRLNSCVSAITQLKQAVRQKEQLSDRQASVKKQKKLQLLGHGQAPRLQRVFIRPNISGRKTVGNLEAHKNGLRFSPIKGQAAVDILYDNIRSCFFQPADNNSLLVVLHFHLHDEIMVGRKKALDIQYCVEVTELSTSLTQAKKRSNFGDADEIHEEEMEREKKRRLNGEFKKFVKKVENVAQQEIEFDIPYKELGFYGVPFKSFVFIQPTVNCLVQLTEQPFFVLSLQDIEICCLERVNARINLRQFDAKFVLKDYSKPVAGIDNIPVEHLDTLKEWLDSCNVKYYQHAKSLQWNAVMKAVTSDPHEFFEMGGWRAVLGEESDSEEEMDVDEDPDDDEFEVDEEEEDYDDDEEDSLEMESGDDSDDEDVSMAEEEEDSEGSAEDWDEMENRLAKEDKKKKLKRQKKGLDFDSDED